MVLSALSCSAALHLPIVHLNLRAPFLQPAIGRAAPREDAVIFSPCDAARCAAPKMQFGRPGKSVEDPYKTLGVSRDASSKEIIGDSLLGVKTPTAALVFRCVTLSRAPVLSHQRRFRLCERHHRRPVSRLTFRPSALRRVVEQYLWHEKTKGRKHKMQIHTYHKVSFPAAQANP